MNRKKIVCLILALVFLLTSLVACDNKETSTSGDMGGKERFSSTFYDAFDTVITITAYCSSQEEFDKLFETAKSMYIDYHKRFDIYNSYEGITNLKDVNDRAGSETVKVDANTIAFLEYAINSYESTNGKMNIAMGSVLRLWHDAREKANAGDASKDIVPSIEELTEAAKHININDVVLDMNNLTVSFKDPLLKLDVGAIAKGYTTELVAQKLTELGGTSVLINAGGNVKTTGPKPNGDLWTIGIQSPQLKGGEAYVETVSIDDKSVVTSGVYERNFTVDGVTYHHIIDPDTLFPENRFLSVSILTSKHSGLADALSTAVFNMDPEEGRAYIESLSGVEAMWILNDMSFVYSSGYEEYISKK